MLKGSEKQPASEHHVTKGRSGQIGSMPSAGSPKIQQLLLLIRKVVEKRCSVSQKIQDWTQSDARFPQWAGRGTIQPMHTPSLSKQIQQGWLFHHVRLRIFRELQ